MPSLSRVPRLATVRRRLRSLARRARQQVPRGSLPPVERVYPPVSDEHTNLGPEMDALVTRAKRNQEPLGVDRDYDLLRENFDHLNFMLQAPVLQDAPRGDPMRVFLRSGVIASNSPNYNFSMKNYLDRYPDKRDDAPRSPYLDWIEHGRAAGEIADPALGIEPMSEVLGLSPHQIVDELVETRTDMMERLRSGTLGEMFAKATEIEPLIAHAWAETPRTRLLPLVGRFVVGQVAAIRRCQEQVGFRRARVLVVTDRLRRGEGRQLQEHLARALADRIVPDDIVVIHTDGPASSMSDALPDGVREADFAAASEGLPDEHRQLALMSLVRSFHADVTINVDSALFYRMLMPYGKGLAASERIFLCFPGREQQPQGSWEGWGQQWLYAGTDIVTGFLTDSDHERSRLVDLFQLGDAEQERIHLLRTPVDPSVAVATPPPTDTSRRPVVFWSGRGDRKKHVTLGIEVARLMPEVDFRFGGDAVVEGLVAAQASDNVHFEGQVGDLSGRDLDTVDAWLHTTTWDGVPNILLEVAMTEVPIVASLVGGVGEVLSESDSWPVVDWQEPPAYVAALREVLGDPAEARGRARALRQRLERERPQAPYAKHTADLLLPDPEETR